MSIRGRLLAAFVALVVALAGLGLWSAWRLRDLGQVAERILADNYLSVAAAHEMRVSLERLDAARAVGAGDLSRAGALEASRTAFAQAFDRAASNITEPGETEIIATLQAQFADYLGTPTGPALAALRQAIDDLDALNASAMHSKSDAAGALARRDVVATVALMSLLALLGAWVTHAVTRRVIDPIETLTVATTRLAAGDLDVTVPVDRADELGQMARAFNDMAARVREARASDRDALTEARRVAERMALLEDVRHLHDLNRLKSEFVAEASHELRTPLTSLQLGLNLLLEERSTLSARHREIVELCRDDGERLAKLARDLLDLSRLESGQRPPRRAPVGVDALIRGAVDPLKRQADARGVALAFDVPAGLADVDVDRAQIERVLTNLVSNAVRATPPGGRIAVSARQDGDGIQLQVADTGIGIAREHLPRLFEPFVQIPGGARGGAGLGLAISHRIVEAHGGTITVQSTPGAGSTFTVTLPRVPPAAEDSAHAHPDRR